MKKKKSREGAFVPKYKISWHRYSKRFVAKIVKEKKSYFFLRQIALGAYFRAVDRETDGRLTIKRKFVTPEERPTREEIIEKTTKYSRMK